VETGLNAHLSQLTVNVTQCETEWTRNEIATESHTVDMTVTLQETTCEIIHFKQSSSIEYLVVCYTAIHSSKTIGYDCFPIVRLSLDAIVRWDYRPNPSYQVYQISLER